jgi:ubiquitin carboxyl-terminal hydrolase 4/11/15
VPLYSKAKLVEIDIDKNATIKTLKEYVGKRFGGVPANRIMASEVYSKKFYKHLEDAATISESSIGVNEDIYFYELDMVPTNWPEVKKKGAKFKTFPQSSNEEAPDTLSSLHDRVLIPVFHRKKSTTSAYRSSGFNLAFWPSFIVLTREEAKDYDTILRKVLTRVAQMTTRSILSELSELGLEQSRPSSDVVLTTEEDASPNDPQVKDGSVEGEDMVEVTMTDAKDTPTLTDESDSIPEVLRPGSYIHPEFRYVSPAQLRIAKLPSYLWWITSSYIMILTLTRNLFEMKHTRKDREAVTTGWSTVDQSRTLEPISHRIRMPSSRDESVQSSANGSSTTSSDEDEDVSQSTTVDASAAIDAANVSSDEEMQSIEPEATENARSGRQNKKMSKKQRKQQRKHERKHKNNKNFKSGKGRVPDQPDYPEDPDDETDEGLIRMGEALVLEWNEQAVDALFGGNSDDKARGQDVMKFLELVDDPEIKEKKAKRAARKKSGIDLDECFTETSKSEVLSEDNAWYCSRCKERRRATKTLEIWTVPDILIIHLKRFSGQRTFRDKMDNLVDFPVEGLDLSGKVGFPEGKDLTYDLFAVDNHYGGLGGGHYTATAQNFFDKQWYDYNGQYPPQQSWSLDGFADDYSS